MNARPLLWLLALLTGTFCGRPSERATGGPIAVNINNLTITNGSAGTGDGGAIYCQGTNLTLDHVVITSNS